jgi:hypothetical protein
MTISSYRLPCSWLIIALRAAGGGLILALLAVASAFVWLKWDDWRGKHPFFYAAEQQLVNLSLRNPVSAGAPPSSFVAATSPANYHCRVVSTTRNVAINPVACRWSYQAIQAYMEAGPVFDLAIFGSDAKNPYRLQAFHEGAGETWDVFPGEEIGESAAVRQLVASGGAVPIKMNRPILRPSADCPVTMASPSELYKRIEAIGGLLETEATGTRDANQDIGRGVRRLYLSSNTVNQVACAFAFALAPHKIDVVLQSPPMDSYVAGYLDRYNDRVWQVARELVGSGFEVMVWSILDRR